MAERTVLDLPAVDYADASDIFYIVRGTAAGRDKQVVAGGGIIASYVYNTTSASVDLATYHGDVELVGEGILGSITLTLSNVLRSSKVLNIINVSATNDLILAGSLVATLKPGHSLRAISNGTSLEYTSFAVVDASGNISTAMGANVTGAITSGDTSSHGLIQIRNSGDGHGGGGVAHGQFTSDGSHIYLINTLSNDIRLQTGGTTRMTLRSGGAIVTGSVDASDGYTCTSGGFSGVGSITTTSGNISTTSGNISTTSGNIYSLVGNIFTSNGWMGADYISLGRTGADGYVSLKRSSDGAAHGSLSSDGTNIILANTGASGALSFQTGSNDRILIDSRGNVGIGRVPENWGTGTTGIDIGGTGAILATTAEAVSSSIYFMENVYYDGVWKRKINDATSMHAQLGGNFVWWADVVGAPDTTFTPTERMRLDVAGNLGLGVTPYVWNSYCKSIDVGLTSAITAFNGVSTNATRIYDNLYINASNNLVHKTTGASSYIDIYDGTFTAYVGGTGTAGSSGTAATAGLTISAAKLITMPGVNAFTTATAANVNVDSSGVLRKSVSSRKYKEDERPLEMDTSKIYDIELKTFNMKGSGQIGHGPIAEDIALVEENFATYDLNGEPEAIHTNHVLYALIEEVRKLQERIEFLEGVI